MSDLPSREDFNRTGAGAVAVCEAYASGRLVDREALVLEQERRTGHIDENDQLIQWDQPRYRQRLVTEWSEWAIGDTND